MNRLYTILLSAATFLAALASCSKPSEGVSEPALKVKESNLVIPADGGVATIEFVGDSEIEVSVDKDWCEASVEGLVASFTAPLNATFETRYVKASVRSKDTEMTFVIQQFGQHTSGFVPQDIRSGCKATAFDLPYNSGDKLSASTDVDWITLKVTEDNLRVALAENMAPGVKTDNYRVAEISWTLGYDSGVFKVYQDNTSFMKVDSNWSVRYDGIKDYEGKRKSYIYNDVTDPTLSGSYLFFPVEKATFDKMGLPMDEFALKACESARESVQEIIDYYADYGQTLSFSDFLYTDTDFEVYDPFEPGDYIAIVLGFDEFGEETGHYAYKEFNVEETGGSEAYNKWLGSWMVDSSFEISFRQKVADESFKMRGWQMDLGSSITSVAGFSTKNETVTLYGDVDNPYAAVTLSDLGECYLFLVGVCDVNGESYIIQGAEGSSAYAVATGTLQNDGSVRFAGQSFSTGDGSTYTFNRLELIVVPLSNLQSYTFLDNAPHDFPLTAVKVPDSSSSLKNISRRVKGLSQAALPHGEFRELKIMTLK